jgi:N-formylmaleamate deformylase
MSNFLEGYLLINNLTLHYYRTGGNKPSLVFVHGFTDNGLYWTRTVQALQADYDIVMVDARGHGQSDRSGGQFTELDRVSDLFGVIKALKLVRPGLIGHSMGGATISLAATRQDIPKEYMPRFLILEDPAWLDTPQPDSEEEKLSMVQARQNYMNDWRKQVEYWQTATYEDALVDLRKEHLKWIDSDLHLSLNARRQVELGLFNLFSLERTPWREIVKNIQCPFLLIIGQQSQGGILSPEQANQAIKLNPLGQYVQIADVGHSIRFDCFEAYLAEVKKFLRD